MSTRQNKKQRKGRNNANNRERTVTTLTEDPNTHYLVPTPSEEPAGSHLTTQFTGPVAGKIHNMPMGPQPYQIPGNFGFAYPGFASLPHSNMPQQQQQNPPQPYYTSSPTSQHPPQGSTLPPGKNDLEILQNLKKIIKDGQHPFFRAVPAPATLASLYKGPIPSSMVIPGNQTFSSSVFAKETPYIQGKDAQPGFVSVNRTRSQEGNNAVTVSQGSAKNGTSPSVANLKLGDLQISKESSGPPSAGFQPEARPSDLAAVHPAVAPTSADVSNSQHPGKFDNRARSWVERKGPDSMDVEPAPKKLPPGPVDAATSGNQKATVVEVKASRDSTPKGLSTDSHVSAFEREVTPSPRRANAFPRPPRARYWSPSGRPLTPNPYTSFEDEQRYFAEQEQQDDNERRVIYDRPDISSEGLQKSFHQENSPRPAQSLGVPTALSDALEAQRPDIRSADAKSHDHISHVSALPSARESVAVRPSTESQPQKQGAKPESNAPPAPPIEQLASDVDDIQSSRASSMPPADTNAAIAPAPPVVTPSAQSSIPPDASSMPPPSLKERIEQPTPMPMPTSALPQAKPQTEVAPAAAATATATAIATATAAAEHHPPAHPERFSKRGKFQKVHHPNGLGRFNRPGTAAESAAAGHGQRIFRPRSPSLDTRKPPRDYRPPRPVSRERGNYRPELHVEPRRPEGVDADAPPPARYEGRPYADYTGSERRPSTYTSSPPPISGGRGPPLEGPPSRGDYYPPYPPPPSRSDWEIDDDYYKSRGWDRPPPSTERELFDREVYPPRPGSWDARAEREFLPRDEYSPLAPAVDDRYITGPPLPREGDRSRPQPGGYPPTYSRVRGRSPSPLGRPGAGPIDDSRPPLKRAREDYPPEYYPSGRAPPARGRPSDYLPPRTGTHGSAVDWPPPPSASSAGMGGGPPAPPVSGGGRDYRMRELPLEYAPAGYNRSPSPLGRQPYPPRGAYARGNDRGGYVMRPRPPS